MSKVLSVVIALVAAVAGYAALWQGSGTLLWGRRQLRRAGVHDRACPA